MTTNQTIDGVPRERIEHYIKLLSTGGLWQVKAVQDELRALLDAPAVESPVPQYFVEACDKFDWTLEEALRFYAEGKHFDTDQGRTRILCTGAIASHALKALGEGYAAMKGIKPAAQLQGEPVDWGAPKTVRQLIRQLETLDQDLRPLSMLRVPASVFEDGRERVRATHLSFSHERVDGQWLAPFKSDGEKVLAFWCRMEQPAPVAQKYDDTLLPFLALMRKELHANSDKGDREGWLGMTSGTALSEIDHHRQKLVYAVACSNSEAIKEHAADVANCAMMLADVCGVLGRA